MQIAMITGMYQETCSKLASLGQMERKEGKEKEKVIRLENFNGVLNGGT